MTRTFRDGRTEAWWAADATLGWWGPDGFTRLVVATADPGTLPDKATWYLATNLPRPGGPREAGSAHPAADPAEIMRICGMRHWIEQSYKQVKDELGWADFQVRSNVAIRRHQALVTCAFSFRWATWFADHPPQHDVEASPPEPCHAERGAASRRAGASAVVAVGTTHRPRLAFPWIALRRWEPASSRSSAATTPSPSPPRSAPCGDSPGQEASCRRMRVRESK